MVININDIQTPSHPAAGLLARYRVPGNRGGGSSTSSGGSNGDSFWQREASRTLRPITADTHPFADAWERAQDDSGICQQLVQLLQIKVPSLTMLGPFLVEERPASPAPRSVTTTATLLVAVQPGSVTVDRARLVIHDICVFLDQHGLLTDLAVEVTEADMTLLTRSTATPPRGVLGITHATASGRGPPMRTSPNEQRLEFEDTYSVNPVPGCSVGLAADPTSTTSSSSLSSGSMGPVFRLSLPGKQETKPETKFLAVSCAHVLTPGKLFLSPPSPDIVDTIPIDPNPTSADQLAAARYMIKSPSPGDHDQWLAHLREEEARLRGQTHQAEPMLFNPPRYDKAASRLKVAETFDCMLGHVFNSSGLRNTYAGLRRDSTNTTTTSAEDRQQFSRCRLDYGTVELTASRSSGPFATVNPQIEYIADMLRPYIKREGLVFASGRTSGHTCGHLLGQAVFVRIRSGDGSVVSETFERAILPCNLNPTGSNRPTPFARPGDSGTLIFDHGRRVGLLWGGITRKRQMSTAASNMSLEAIPMQDLGVNIEDLVFYTPIDVIVSAFKDKLNEAYGEGNFALRWAADNDDVPAL